MKTISADAVMQALVYPFERGLAVFPGGRSLLVNPAPGNGPWAAGQTVVWQWWKAPADHFSNNGFTVQPVLTDSAGPFSAVLLRLSRQREEAQYCMARAWAMLRPGGLFMAAAANDAGGKRLEDDLGEVLHDVQASAKHKCRIAWVIKGDDDLPARWADAGAMRIHDKTGMWTQPGLFSWDRNDAATSLLLSCLPDDFRGRVADPGCGTGVIADHVLQHCSGIDRMLCYDADARAVEACRRNLAARHPGRAADCAWVDLSVSQSLAIVDAVVMNPPFHAEKAQNVGLGQSFIGNASAMLRPGGALWMVANAHLPYEELLARQFKTVEKITQAQGFKVIRAVR